MPVRWIFKHNDRSIPDECVTVHTFYSHNGKMVTENKMYFGEN